MTKAERIGFLEMIKEDIHVCSLDATFYEIMKECALSETIQELKKSVGDAQPVDAVPIDVLDKIRTEIKAMFPPSGNWMYDEGYSHEQTVCEVLVAVLKIIDEYRGEKDETDN